MTFNPVGRIIGNKKTPQEQLEYIDKESGFYNEYWEDQESLKKYSRRGND
jgi:hypothetical protein